MNATALAKTNPAEISQTSSLLYTLDIFHGQDFTMGEFINGSHGNSPTGAFDFREPGDILNLAVVSSLFPVLLYLVDDARRGTPYDTLSTLPDELPAITRGNPIKGAVIVIFVLPLSKHLSLFPRPNHFILPR
jgi:hypothetical protein